MINYTATIFAESGSDISPSLSAIICGAIQLLGTLVSTKLVDRAGRKVHIWSYIARAFQLKRIISQNSLKIFIDCLSLECGESKTISKLKKQPLQMPTNN